jgi:hypothetical protein
MEDVAANHEQWHRDEIVKVVRCLCLKTPYKLDLQGQDLKDLFWEEWTAFKNEKGQIFGNKKIWTSHPRKKGLSHIWHARYSLRVTKLLGFVACRVTSKSLGIGAAERSWCDVKQLKTNTRSHMSIKSVGKQAIMFGAASTEEARIKRQATEKIEGTSSH